MLSHHRISCCCCCCCCFCCCCYGCCFCGYCCRRLLQILVNFLLLPFIFLSVQLQCNSNFFDFLESRMDALAFELGWSRRKFKFVAAIIFVIVFGFLAVPLSMVCCINGFCPYGKVCCRYDVCREFNPAVSGIVMNYLIPTFHMQSWAGAVMPMTREPRGKRKWTDTPTDGHRAAKKLSLFI